MKRRNILKTMAAFSAASGLTVAVKAQAEFSYSTPIVVDKKLSKPESDPIKVAFVIGEGAQLIDFAGPWEVFQDVYLPSDKTDNSKLTAKFELYTVAESREAVVVSGGMTILPNYSINEAPEPNLIVIPHFENDGYSGIHDWIKDKAPKTDLTMSVCIGSFQLAKTGLLDGKMATTNQIYLDRFAKAFPKIDVQHGPRYVEVDGFATAGGLTAGIDLALRTVDRYFGRKTTQGLADFLEYTSQGWKV